MARDVFLCDAVRTPIGRYAGALAKVRADDLAAALDTRGAVIGACGLFFFAFSVHSLLPVLPVAAALGLATLAWFASSVLIWRLR